jgi:hypothetical protein
LLKVRGIGVDVAVRIEYVDLQSGSSLEISADVENVPALINECRVSNGGSLSIEVRVPDHRNPHDDVTCLARASALVDDGTVHVIAVANPRVPEQDGRVSQIEISGVSGTGKLWLSANGESNDFCLFDLSKSRDVHDLSWEPGGNSPALLWWPSAPEEQLPQNSQLSSTWVVLEAALDRAPIGRVLGPYPVKLDFGGPEPSTDTELWRGCARALRKSTVPELQRTLL